MTPSHLQTILDTPLFRSNTVRDLFDSVLIFAGSMFVLWILKAWGIGRLRKAANRTSGKLDDFLVDLFEKGIMPILYAGSIYVAVWHLDLAKSAHHAVTMGFKAVLIIQAVRLLLSMLTYMIQNAWFKSIAPGNFAVKTTMGLVRFVVWSIAAIFLIDNLGFDVNSVLAGLGIGGVAVALASQAILGDLFNYFVIIFDQPFREGDFIVVDDFKGEIEKIGVKSTRIRSLDGDQLIISNTNLTGSRIRNFKRMFKRRILFKVGIVYQTPIEQVRRIPGMIKKIITDISGTTFDRCHFQSFADSSLVIETVYFVEQPDYNKYMDIQHEVNLAIMEVFQREKIEFAFPTQTVYNYGEIPSEKLVKN